MFKEFIPLISKWFDDITIRGEKIPDEYGQVSGLKLDHIHLEKLLSEFASRMGQNYPFHIPEYAGQMLKPPHPVAWLAYTLAMSINPNNHALDGGPPTSEMEKEVIGWFSELFEFPQNSLGHLTSGGTVANLEALWIASKIHPNKKIAFSEQAHYTHKRMCDVLRIDYKIIDYDYVTSLGDDFFETLADVGTVVVTMGTTGTGSIEPLDRINRICKNHGVRVHVDAAYGGFFKLIEDELRHQLDWEAISKVDSIVIDPHKHGLQPYGCGCVLFRDPSVGKFYKHDSPYTYFSSNELHLGEITLECSRAGASAAALWFTIKALGLDKKGVIGQGLLACIKAALTFSEAIRESNEFEVLSEPETDIVCYFPKFDSVSKISRASQAIFNAGMESKDNRLYLSLFKVNSKQFGMSFPEIIIDEPVVTILRSVFMKPSHIDFIDQMVHRLQNLKREIITN